MREQSQKVMKVVMRLRRWALRIVAFYFGYKILHRQVYEVDQAEPLLIALGLWLCGIAPADIFDGLRKLGDRVTTESGSVIGPPTPKPESGSTGNGDAS